MPALNTPKLTNGVIQTMNNRLRSLSVSVGEIDDLADFYGVGVKTVQRWFVPVGSETPELPYSPCVPAFARDRRVFQLFDEDDEDGGFGDPNDPEKPLMNLRLRIFLTAALTPEGFAREPIFHGPTRQLNEGKGSLSACVDRMNSIYTGNDTIFLQQAWWKFTIIPINDGNNPWLLTVFYNLIAPGDKSDGAEKMSPEITA